MQKKINLILGLAVINVFLLVAIGLSPVLKDKGLHSKANSNCDHIWVEWVYDDIGWQLYDYMLCLQYGDGPVGNWELINETSAYDRK